MKLVLIRGLPGSGKSTTAKAMTDVNGVPFTHVEADMWFCRHDGIYKFVGSEIAAAHDWCQKKAAEILEAGGDVVVSNTFTQFWEMVPYIEMAKTLKADIFLIEAQGEYGSVHNIPEAAMERMRKRWEILTLSQLKEFVA